MSCVRAFERFDWLGASGVLEELQCNPTFKYTHSTHISFGDGILFLSGS